MCSNDDQGRVYQNCNFHEPRGVGVFLLGCGHINHIVKLHYFFKNLLLIRQTMYILLMTNEGSTKIENFKTSGTGVLM